MANNDKYILPLILETLSNKPKSSANVVNLCDEIQDIVNADYPDAGESEIRNAIEKAMEIGESLGIISMANDNARMAFKIGKNKKQTAMDEIEDYDSMDDAADIETNQTLRRKGPSPKKRAPLSEQDSEYLMMTTRKQADKAKLVPSMDRMGRRRSSSARRPRRARSSRGRVSRRRVSRRRR